MTMGNHKDILIKKYILRLMCWGFQGPRFCPEEHTSHTTDKNVFQLKNIKYSAKGKDKWEQTLKMWSKASKRPFPVESSVKELLVHLQCVPAKGTHLRLGGGSQAPVVSRYPHSRYPTGQLVLIWCNLYHLQREFIPSQYTLSTMECQQRFQNQSAQTAVEDQPREKGFLMRVSQA